MLATICLLLLALISSSGVKSHTLNINISRSTTKEISTISICTLLSKPADYNGKEIRISAAYHFGFEYNYFDDLTCKEYAVETTPYWNGNVIWATFDLFSVASSTKPRVYKQFRRVTEGCCIPGQGDTHLELVVVGRFSKADDNKGYGSAGRYALQLVVSKIEKISVRERPTLSLPYKSVN